MNDVVSMEYYI